MTIRERVRRRYVASFNWERIGFRSRWITAVFYLKRGTYEIWLFGRCWHNLSNVGEVIETRQFCANEGFIPYDPEMQPFDMTMAGGFVVSFKSMKTNLKVGKRIEFWGKSYIVADREEKDGFLRYSLTPDSIPEVKYLGSTADGDRVSHSQRRADAAAYFDAGKRRVANTPPPINQKYAPGTRVRIAADLGPAMRHFPKDRMATVRYIYAHAFGGDDVKSYCLDIDGIGETSWYNEDQLAPTITAPTKPEFPPNISIREGNQPR